MMPSLASVVISERASNRGKPSESETSPGEPKAARRCRFVLDAQVYEIAKLISCRRCRFSREICPTGERRSRLYYVAGAIGNLSSSGSWLLTTRFRGAQSSPFRQILSDHARVKPRRRSVNKECGGPRLPVKESKTYPTNPKRTITAGNQ